MILDQFNTYSDAQALTATAVSTNVVDHGADRNLGIGEPLVAVIQVDVALDSTDGNETYSAVFQTDSDEAFGTAVTVATFPTMTRGAAAGTRYIVSIPPSTTMNRYSRISYTLGGTTPTATVTAYLLPQNMLQNQVEYADNITIS